MNLMATPNKEDHFSLDCSSPDSSFEGFSDSNIDLESDTKNKGDNPNIVKDPLNTTEQENKDISHSKGHKKKEKKEKKSKKKSKKSKKSMIDLNNLSLQDIINLKSIFGTPEAVPSGQVHPNEQTETPVTGLNLHVPLNNLQYDEENLNKSGYDDIDSQDNTNPVFFAKKLGSDMQKCLFDDENSSSGHNLMEDEDEIWDLPKLKAPDRGAPVGESLAKMISMACTNPCQTNELVSKYHVPSNCEAMCAPQVNEEIWGELVKYRKVQSTDRSLRDIQNLVTSSMLPILELCNILKSHSVKIPEAKTCLTDTLNLLGQVQYNLSIKRRYLMRPFLKPKYFGICSLSTPITTYLFGDDLNKEIKKCETIVKVGKNTNPLLNPFARNARGRGYSC